MTYLRELVEQPADPEPPLTIHGDVIIRCDHLELEKRELLTVHGNVTVHCTTCSECEQFANERRTL